MTSRREPRVDASHRDRVQRLTAAQHGLISRRQALHDLNVPSKAYDGWLRRGWLEGVRVDGKRLPGVHRIAGVPETPEQRALACTLRCGPGARLVGAVPLAIMRIEGFSVEDEPVVVIPPPRRVRTTSFRVRTNAAPGQHQASIGSFPSVTVTRNLIEAADSLEDLATRVAFDSARWMGATTVDRLQRTLEDLPASHRGAARFQRLWVDGAFVQESEGERRLAPILQSVGERVRWGVWIAPDIRVDAILEDARLVIEYDGRDSHQRALQQAKDERRAARIRALGYEVLRIRHEDLADPGAVQRLILTAIVRRTVTLQR